jgi:hypothetical protein
MTKHSFASLVLTMSLLATTSAWGQAQIYRCVDAAGRITYINVSSAIDKHCKRLQIESDMPSSSASSVPAKSVGRTPGAAARPTPVNFPRVGPDEQKTRDSDRRAILNQELDAAQQYLAAAKHKLAEQERIRPDNELPPQRQKRLQPFQEDVVSHERNIAEISKELANLK